MFCSTFTSSSRPSSWETSHYTGSHTVHILIFQGIHTNIADFSVFHTQIQIFKSVMVRMAMLTKVGRWRQVEYVSRKYFPRFCPFLYLKVAPVYIFLCSAVVVYFLLLRLSAYLRELGQLLILLIHSSLLQHIIHHPHQLDHFQPATGPPGQNKYTETCILTHLRVPLTLFLPNTLPV